jgi:hypothetical protein
MIIIVVSLVMEESVVEIEMLGAVRVTRIRAGSCDLEKLESLIFVGISDSVARILCLMQQLILLIA